LLVILSSPLLTVSSLFEKRVASRFNPLHLTLPHPPYEMKEEDQENEENEEEKNELLPFNFPLSFFPPLPSLLAGIS